MPLPPNVFTFTQNYLVDVIEKQYGKIDARRILEEVDGLLWRAGLSDSNVHGLPTEGFEKEEEELLKRLEEDQGPKLAFDLRKELGIEDEEEEEAKTVVKVEEPMDVE
jgi:hypothetical protein